MKGRIFIFLLVLGCESETDHTGHGMSKDIASGEMESFLKDVVMPANQVVLSSQQTVKPVWRKIAGEHSFNGYIAVDQRRSNKISARFGGRVAKLHIKYKYQYVKKGEKIMEVYSPEISTIEEEYIHHLRVSGDQELIKKAREKLLLLGLGEDEIAAVENSGQPSGTVSVISPYEGYAMAEESPQAERIASPSGQSGMKMEMASPEDTEVKSGGPVSPRIREGAYVSTGQVLFVINDLKTVWVLASIPPGEERRIKINTPILVQSELTDVPIEANINFVEPVYKKNQKFTQVRVYLSNERQLFKINSLVMIRLPDEKQVYSIPSGAIINLGRRKVVWVKEGKNLFKAKVIMAGYESGGFTEIVSGLTGGEEIAKDAGYMSDSESFINTEEP